MEEENKTSEVAIGTLYDLNKDLVKRTEIKLSEGVLNSKKEIIKNFIIDTANNYYMLLCNERKDYTIFDFETKLYNGYEDLELNKKRSMDCAKCLVDECLLNRGEIRGIDITKDKQAIEIWMLIEDEAYVYYFFPYDNGVIVDF